MPHTAGPWTVKTHPNDPNAYDVYAGGTPITRGYWAHNGAADARLIAAAPDLLFCCKKLLEAYEKRAAISEGWVSEIRAAIAQAEGR